MLFSPIHTSSTRIRDYSMHSSVSKAIVPPSSPATRLPRPPEVSPGSSLPVSLLESSSPSSLGSSTTKPPSMTWISMSPRHPLRPLSYPRRCLRMACTACIPRAPSLADHDPSEPLAPAPRPRCHSAWHLSLPHEDACALPPPPPLALTRLRRRRRRRRRRAWSCRMHGGSLPHAPRCWRRSSGRPPRARSATAPSP